ncbi:MAG: hypothetical protein QOI70_1869, partial [Microbacteriaceae bacterium]|nr:hypothetical protein [Microbacteriaceae bacterium]
MSDDTPTRGSEEVPDEAPPTRRFDWNPHPDGAAVSSSAADSPADPAADS